MTQASQGDDLMKKAKQTANKMTFFNIVSNRYSNYKEAIIIYDFAATAYKLENNLSSAAKAYIAAGDLNYKLNTYYAGGDAYLEAANCLKSVNISSSEQWYRRAAECYLEGNHFSLAIKALNNLSEILTGDDLMNFYLEMIYVCEKEKTVLIYDILAKFAEFLIFQKDDFIQAADCYQKIADHRIKTSIKTAAHPFELKVILCYLVVDDLVKARRMYDQYSLLDQSFNNSGVQSLIKLLKEKSGKPVDKSFDKSVDRSFSNFCLQLIEAVSNNNSELFTNLVANYKSSDKIDDHLFSRVKRLFYQLQINDESLA